MLILVCILIKRELALVWARPGTALRAVLFYLLLAMLFPLALSGETELLAKIAPAILWIGALLSLMLAIPQMYHPGAVDGTLDQYRLLPMPIAGIALAKIVSYWIIYALPLVLISPLLALILHMPLEHEDEAMVAPVANPPPLPDAPDAKLFSADSVSGGDVLPQAYSIHCTETSGVLSLSLTLAMGLLGLVALGNLAAALTASIKRNDGILTLLVLPLALPILIFGAHAMENPQGAWLLAGTILVMLPLSIWLSAAALRE